METNVSLKEVFHNVSQFLDQNDLVMLCQVNHDFRNLAARKLYCNILINKHPVYRSSEWWIGCGKTYVSGFRAVKKSEDQNDLFLYDRLERLLESHNLDLIETLVIQEDVFNDMETGAPLLQRLIDELVRLNRVTHLDIRDSTLFQRNKELLKRLSNSVSLRVQELDSLNDLANIESLKTIEIFVTLPSFDHITLDSKVKSYILPSLEELVIDDLECSSLRVFQFFQEQGVVFSGLKRLKFNHVHGIHDYNKTSRELTADFLQKVILLPQVEALEMEITCEEPGCTCLDDFLADISPFLISLRSLALIERTFTTQGNHYTEEMWDLSINRFMLNLPNVGENLQKLSIRHNCPLNGIQEDSVEGNYIRRRTLYEEVLPQFKSLRTLIAPTLLQSLSSYEILVCDLLWNECECEKRQRVLDILDQYIQNHQYYSYDEGRYKDIIPTVFFAYAGDSLCKRFLTETNWDLKSLECAPTQYMWNMHGYESIQHFDDYECYFDESVYPHLTQVISHFFNDYMKALVKMLPNLTVCLLSGIYYQVSKDHVYYSRYDN